MRGHTARRCAQLFLTQEAGTRRHVRVANVLRHMRSGAAENVHVAVSSQSLLCEVEAIVKLLAAEQHLKAHCEFRTSERQPDTRLVVGGDGRHHRSRLTPCPAQRAASARCEHARGGTL